MAWSRSTPIVATVARIAQLTGKQKLANLESGGELLLEDLILSANQDVFDWLDGSGQDPTKFTNEYVYERTVAFWFLALLATHPTNYLGGSDPEETSQRYRELAESHFGKVSPRYATGAQPRRAGEGLPAIHHLDEDPVYFYLD